MAEKDTPVDSTTPILDEEDETVSSEQDSLPLNESSQDSSYEGDDEGDDSYEDDDEGDEGEDEGDDSYEDDDEGEDSYEGDEGDDSYEDDEGEDSYATEGPDEEEAVDPVVFDKDIMGREEPEPKFKEYGVDDSNRKLELPNIPEYANRRNISMRHKLLENALLTPELIKLFDIICQNITMREKNYFNIADFLMSPNFSLTQKEHLQHNFFKLVDLLTEKTVDLVKVQERRPDNSAISISLNDSKNFDLVLFHKFNDFLLKNYNERNPLRKPILYQLEQIAENIKTTKEKLLPFCINVPLQEINGEYLRKLISEEPENSGKLALAINLENEQFGEAIFPFRLAKELLPYLCRQIIEYLNNVRNEKTTVLITRKLRESKIAYINIKKALMKPNPHNAEFSAFIRIFYNILSQVYQRNINYSTKKIKDTEIFLVLALVTRQLVLNAKLNTSQEDTSPKLITTNMVIHKLFEQAKEINRKVVCVPATLNTLVKKPSKYNGMKVKMDHDQLISAFQTLNSDVHTIKEILILRHDSTNYYLHRTCIVPLFINLLAEEKRKIKSAIEKEIRANHRLLLKNKSSFEAFITQRVNLVLQLVYECLIRCLMTNKPIAYQDNQALYWMNRLFLTKEEVVRFELENTGFDFNEEEKRSIFKNLIKTLTYSNKNFKTIAEVLDVPYENYAHRSRFSLFNLIGRFLDRLFGVNTLNKISTTPPPTSDGTNKRPGLEYHRPEVDKHKPEPEHRRPKSDYPKSDLDYYIPELDNRRAIHKRPIASPHKKRTNFGKKARENTKKLIERFESKLPLLKEPATLQQKIDEALENWNLKLGESRKHNQQTIDGIINGCIVRLDNNEIAGKDFDSIYEVILRNNPPVGKIKNQDALKKYMMYKIIYNKYKRLAKR